MARIDDDGGDVAVVVPAYNAAATIEQALTSAMRQERPPAEVVVVDDGSRDGTAEVVARAFPAVTLVRTENRGPSAARNEGLARVRSPWVAFLDADDEWHPAKLRLQLSVLAKHPGAKLVACAWTRGEPRLPAEDSEGTVVRLTWRDIARQNAFQTSTAVVARDLALGVGGFRPAYDAAEDWDFWLRASMATDVLYLPLPLVRYRAMPAGVSRDLGRVYERGIAMLKDWQEEEGRLAPAEFHRLLVWQHVRFAYNLWHEGLRHDAWSAVKRAEREASLGVLGSVVLAEFLPYLLRRGLRRVLPRA
jgi:glycosyltransferase involved in cell wall biosynthesis